MQAFVDILWVLILICLNAFFVASEFALVNMRRTRITELVRRKDSAAKLVEDAVSDLGTYISATQLGVTLASLGLGWVGEPAIARILEPFFSVFPHTIAFISVHSISVLLAFLLISYLHIVLGELIPKSIALQKSETLALFLIVPLALFAKVFTPAIYVLNSTAKGILTLFGLSTSSEQQVAHSEEEIKIILAQSGKSGKIEQAEVDMVNNVFKLGEIPVRKIMIPRTDLVAFPDSIMLSDVVKELEKYSYSRFPIYSETIDKVIGFIHVKDTYKAILHFSGEKRLKDTSLIRKVIHVPESKRADEVLVDMRKLRIHLAVVLDEFSGTAGIVTLEDIIESLVGEIQDEFEKPATEIRKLKDGSYLMHGLTSIETVQRIFPLPVRGQGYVTIGGLIFGVLGHVPKEGDSIQLGAFQLSVEKITKRRITEIKVKKVPSQKE